MSKIIRTLGLIIFGILCVSVGSYINFYSENTWMSGLKIVLFPVPLVLIACYVIYKIRNGLIKFKKMFTPKRESKKNDISEYQKYRDKLKTGDVVAFSSNGLSSLPIKVGTWSRFTHVGLVISIPFPGSKERVFFIEADDKKGVVLVRLSSKLETYKGSAYLCKLDTDDDEVRRVVKDNIYEYTMGQLGKGYDFPAIKGIADNVLGLVSEFNKQDDGSFICSELVGRAFQEAELVTKAKTASYFSPRDVVEFKCLKSPIKLIG